MAQVHHHLMTLVILESPLAGDTEANRQYARACMRDCLLNHGEAPFASHLLYDQPGLLHDTVPDERALGIEAGLRWGRLAERTVVYTDRGISDGMRHGIKRAKEESRPVVYRKLPGYAIGDPNPGMPHTQPEPGSDGRRVRLGVSIEECAEAVEARARAARARAEEWRGERQNEIQLDYDQQAGALEAAADLLRRLDEYAPGLATRP